MDDWQLLNEYATRHSEEAFRTLVDRYTGASFRQECGLYGWPCGGVRARAEL